VLDQHRSAQRKPAGAADDAAALTADITALARQYAATASAGSRRCYGLKAGAAAETRAVVAE